MQFFDVATIPVPEATATYTPSMDVWSIQRLGFTPLKEGNLGGARAGGGVGGLAALGGGWVGGGNLH